MKSRANVGIIMIKILSFDLTLDMVNEAKTNVLLKEVMMQLSGEM